MKNKFTILGCGSSLGSPWITNYSAKLKKNSKNIRTRCCAHIQKGDLSILIDTSPDIKNQFLKNKITSLDAIIYTMNTQIKHLVFSKCVLFIGKIKKKFQYMLH